MADKKVSELIATGSITDPDVFLVVQGGVSKKTTKADIFASTVTALALKADAAATTSALALKADATAVNDALYLKADITALNLKADVVASYADVISLPVASSVAGTMVHCASTTTPGGPCILVSDGSIWKVLIALDSAVAPT